MSVELQITPSEYAARVAGVRRLMAESELDAIVVWGRGGGTIERYGNVLYLCGHYAVFPTIRDVPGVWSDRGYAAVVVTADELVLCSEDVDAEPIGATRHLALDGRTGGSLGELVGEALLGGSGLRIGVVGSDTMTAKQLAAVDRATEGLRRGALVLADDLVETVRSIKSETEIALLRRAGEIGNRALTAGAEFLVPGARETDAVAAMVAELTRNEAVMANAFVYTFGAEAPGIPAPPTYSNRVLQVGDLFTVDLTGAYRGYFFDFARSRVVGAEPTAAQEAAYRLARTSIDAAADAAKPGATVGDLARAADELLAEGGYDFEHAEFQAGGHGLGLGFEAPWIRPENERPIEVGMTLALERFVVMGGTAATFERNVVITADGAVDLAPVLDLW